MSKRIAVIIGIAVLLLATTVFAQTAQINQCRTANLRAHSEVLQLFNRARAASRITPAEAQQFSAMEGRLRSMQANLNRGGLTLAECQAITRQIASERAAVQRMAATPAVDPRVNQCRAANQSAHNQVLQIFNQARSRGNITPAEAQAFANMERTLSSMTQALNQGGLTLAECQRLTQQIASERAAVQRMAAGR